MCTYYIGWDVGAWHCDRKNAESKDAIYILNAEKISDIRYIRTCIREEFDQKSITDFLNSLFSSKTKKYTEKDTYYFAIDAVFSWPKTFIDLLQCDNNQLIKPEEYKKKPYLFRYIEQEISNKLKQTLSVIQHSIGSQSTKIMFFLKKFGFKQNAPTLGVWENEKGNAFAIETYPALLILGSNQSSTELHPDIIDAQKCSLLAKEYATDKNNAQLMSPNDYLIQYLNSQEDKDKIQKQIEQEGWIWLPKAIWNRPQETKDSPIPSP